MKEKYQKDYPVNDDFWDYDKCSFEVPENQEIPAWEEPDMGQKRGYRVIQSGLILMSKCDTYLITQGVLHCNHDPT